jgi:hypothetical protein
VLSDIAARSNNPLPSPGGLDGLIQEILQAIFGVSPTSTAPPANHTNFQDIKQAGMTQQTAGTPMSGGTNLYAQAGGNPSARLHDFVTFTFNLGADFGGTIHFTIDRYGHVYFGGGAQVGKSPGLVSFSYSGGDLNPSTPATPLQLKNFLTGWSVDCSYGKIGGGADVSYTFYTPLKGQYAVSYGAFSPQAGCAVTDSIQLP